MLACSYYNALNVVNEIGGKDPLKTLRWTTPLAVIVVGILCAFFFPFFDRNVLTNRELSDICATVIFSLSCFSVAF